MFRTLYFLRAVIDTVPEYDSFRFAPHLVGIAISGLSGWGMFGVAQILFWLGGHTLDLISFLGFLASLASLACFTALPPALLPPKLQEGVDIVIMVMGGMLLGFLLPVIILY